MAVKSAWDYSHLGPLSARERLSIAMHERLHLECSRKSMSAEEQKRAEAAIAALLAGPRVRVLNVVLASDGFNAATDLAVNRVLAEAGIKAPPH